MININILKIASNTKFSGLKNVYTHKSKIKNRICGDQIEIEINVKNNKINLMRYETKSCIYCQASASILANKIDVFTIKKFRNELAILNKSIKNAQKKLPVKFKAFSKVIHNKNLNRFDCIMLPFNALLKALKL